MSPRKDITFHRCIMRRVSITLFFCIGFHWISLSLSVRCVKETQTNMPTKLYTIAVFPPPFLHIVQIWEKLPQLVFIEISCMAKGRRLCCWTFHRGGRDQWTFSFFPGPLLIDRWVHSSLCLLLHTQRIFFVLCFSLLFKSKQINRKKKKGNPSLNGCIEGGKWNWWK